MSDAPRILGLPAIRFRWARLAPWWGRATYTEPQPGLFEPEGWEWLYEADARPFWPFGLVLLACLAFWGAVLRLLLT